MYYGHDDGSNDPLPVTPLPARDRSFFGLMRQLVLRERNARDERQAKAAAANAPHHAAAEATRAAQLGRDLPAAAARMLARLGRGS